MSKPFQKQPATPTTADNAQTHQDNANAVHKYGGHDKTGQAHGMGGANCNSSSQQGQVQQGGNSGNSGKDGPYGGE